jgi:predicted polyphosphate/ATP-dependent NAD kinase
MPRIGLIINPIAGMGGAVGLKGTDGQVLEARQRGAIPKAGERARAALCPLAQVPDIEFLTCSGAMGEDVLRSCRAPKVSVLYRYDGESTSEDTKRAAHIIRDHGVDLLLFCGGDGTARDIFDAVGREIPVLGIPAGVKMYSAVFTIDPAGAAEIAQKAGSLSLKDAEILDVDEEAYRSGELSTRLYGVARVPALAGGMQLSKHVVEEQDEERAKDEIARFVTEAMLPGTVYILGAGTTTERIARRLGLRKTLLGVDAVKDGKTIALDADEKTLLGILRENEDARIIVSPIGAQGFILGRGSQQISADVVRRVGVPKIIVIATPGKCAETPVLHVDTGDNRLDAEFGEYMSVITGYRIARRIPLVR